MMNTITTSALTLAALLCGSSQAQAQLPAPWPEGNARFYKIANSGFDSYLASTSPSLRQWMRKAFTRAQVYSPFFDVHTGWYPKGWAYKDAYAIKPEWPVFQAHPEWILRDPAGNMLYIDWDCDGSTCPQFAADFGNPEFRAWWIAEAQGLIAQGYRGLWMDDINMDWRISDGTGSHVTPIDPRTGQLMQLEDWRRYMAEFSEAVRNAMPSAELTHNVVWYACPTDNPFLQRAISAADYINLERGVNDLGLVAGTGFWSLRNFLSFVDWVHGQGKAIVMMDYAPDVTQREYGLAGYLLMNTGRDLTSTDRHEWSSPGSWYRPYNIGIGSAFGPRYDWQGILRRDFTRGVVLLTEPNQPPATYDLGAPFRKLDGSVVTSVWLGDRDAVILLRM